MYVCRIVKEVLPNWGIESGFTCVSTQQFMSLPPGLVCTSEDNSTF